VVHWDGKLLPDLTVGSESSDAGLIDRLPVLVSSLTDGTTKLLGVPKLKSGTGNVAANAVLEQVRSTVNHSLLACASIPRLPTQED